MVFTLRLLRSTNHLQPFNEIARALGQPFGGSAFIFGAQEVIVLFRYRTEEQPQRYRVQTEKCYSAGLLRTAVCSLVKGEPVTWYEPFWQGYYA